MLLPENRCYFSGARMQIVTGMLSHRMKTDQNFTTLIIADRTPIDGTQCGQTPHLKWPKNSTNLNKPQQMLRAVAATLESMPGRWGLARSSACQTLHAANPSPGLSGPTPHPKGAKSLTNPDVNRHQSAQTNNFNLGFSPLTSFQQRARFVPA